MNDPLNMRPYFLWGEPWGGWHWGPALPRRKPPRGLSQLCSGGLGPIHPAEAFFFRKRKKRKKNPGGKFACFFLLFWCSIWHEEKRMFWRIFFFWGGVVRGGWGWEFLFCWLDLFWRVWWCFWVCSLDVFGWFLVNCHCFQFCKKPLATWNNPSKKFVHLPGWWQWRRASWSWSTCAPLQAASFLESNNWDSSSAWMNKTTLTWKKNRCRSNCSCRACLPG